jgi:hypothetical protein
MVITGFWFALFDVLPLLEVRGIPCKVKNLPRSEKGTKEMAQRKINTMGV